MTIDHGNDQILTSLNANELDGNLAIVCIKPCFRTNVIHRSVLLQDSCLSEHGAVCERGGVTEPSITLQCLWELPPSPPHLQSEILWLPLSPRTVVESSKSFGLGSFTCGSSTFHRTNNTGLPADVPEFKSALLNTDIGRCRYIKKWQISARYIGRPLVFSLFWLISKQSFNGLSVY